MSNMANNRLYLVNKETGKYVCIGTSFMENQDWRPILYKENIQRIVDVLKCENWNVLNGLKPNAVSNIALITESSDEYDIFFKDTPLESRIINVTYYWKPMLLAKLKKLFRPWAKND